MPQRGDLIAVSLPGEFGKPRPAVVIQSDVFNATATLTVIPLTSTVLSVDGLRVRIAPTDINRLRELSTVMVERPYTIIRDKAGEAFGQLTEEEMANVTESLALFLGLA